MQRTTLGKNSPGWWQPERRRICNPLPYHLAMPPLVESLLAANPEDMPSSDRELYPTPSSCAKCGGLFVSTPVHAYELTSTRHLLLCARCAACGICSGEVAKNDWNRETWEHAAWSAIAPETHAGTQDDAAVTAWLLDLIVRQDGHGALEAWAARAAEERSKA